MESKNVCQCIYCGKKLSGFVECNCNKKFLNKELWNTKAIGGRGRKSKYKRLIYS